MVVHAMKLTLAALALALAACGTTPKGPPLTEEDRRTGAEALRAAVQDDTRVGGMPLWFVVVPAGAVSDDAIRDRLLENRDSLGLCTQKTDWGITGIVKVGTNGAATVGAVIGDGFQEARVDPAATGQDIEDCIRRAVGTDAFPKPRETIVIAFQPIILTMDWSSAGPRPRPF
jgi:hypothetical protein